MEFIFDLPEVPIATSHPTEPSTKKAKALARIQKRAALEVARGTSAALRSSRIVAQGGKSRARAGKAG